MRIGLLCRSLGIPLAFPIIYPRLQLPSRATPPPPPPPPPPLLPPSAPSLPPCPVPRAPLGSHVVWLYKLQDFPTSHGKMENFFSLSFSSIYVYIYFFFFLFLILYPFLNVFCFISFISSLRSFNVLVSFFFFSILG